MLAFPAGLLLLLAVLPLVAYHLFARERLDLPVPSLLFFRDLREERPPTLRRRVARFRGSLLFWLQLLLLVLVCAALAGPVDPGHGAAAAFVLDTSASMAAREEGGTRFEAARALLRADLAALPPRQPAALLAVDAGCRLVAGPSERREVLEERLLALAPAELPTRLDAAAALLRYLGARQPFERVIVYTDREPPVEPALSALVRPRVTWRRVGGPRENLGIVHLGVESHLVGEGVHRVQVRVANSGRTDRDARLAVEPADAAPGPGQPTPPAASRQPPAAGQARVRVPAGGQASVEIELPASPGPVAVRLLDEDALPLDDVAYVVLPGGSRAGTAVGLVAEGAPSPRLAALGRLPGVRLAPGGEGAEADVLLRELEDLARAPFPPLPSITFLAAGAPAPLRPRGGAARLRLVPWSPEHPVTSGVLAERVLATRSAALSPPPGAEPLYRVGDAGRVGEAWAAFALEEGGHRHAVFGFPAQEALEEDAGVLLALKALEWVHPGTVRPGWVLRTSEGPPARERAGRWTGPEGDLSRPPERFAPAGIYRVKDSSGEERVFAASLLDPEESDLTPRPAAFPFAEARPAAGGAEGAAAADRPSPRAGPLEGEALWRPFAWAAAGILLAEWLVFAWSLKRRRPS